MANRAFVSALSKDLPILFVYVGWANRYDGTEPVRGSHGFLRDHPEDNSEAEAFRSRRGKFTCGIGYGIIEEQRMHIIFVARDPADNIRKVVGAYADATPLPRPNSRSRWHDAVSRECLRIPSGVRPSVGAWAGDTGMRRWARRQDSFGVTHSKLLRVYRRVVALARRGFPQAPASSSDDQTYADLVLVEGKLRLQLLGHRAREGRLRDAKIRQVIDDGEGLTCQVPGCGFDFEKKYGPLGRGFAHVHHLKPLSKAAADGRKTSLEDLLVVCANCHAMIHRGGECRNYKTLISGGRRGYVGSRR